jgi:hypothetical protein
MQFYHSIYLIAVASLTLLVLGYAFVVMLLARLAGCNVCYFNALASLSTG